MARRPWTSVEEHYASRHRPYGQNVGRGARNPTEREPAMESKGPALRNNRPQDVEDQHDDRTSPRGYYNDVPAGSWLRSDGTRMPGFDRDNSWRKGRAGSDDWGSGSDPAVIRKPEPNKP